jgi:hypothetical protein
MKFRQSILIIVFAFVISSCVNDDLHPTVTTTFSENFENGNQWEIKLQKEAADTITRVELIDKKLTLIAAQVSNINHNGASALARKTIPEINLNNYGVIEEITLKIKCSPLYLISYFGDYTESFEITIGPYVIRQYSDQSFASSQPPPVVEFDFKITIPANTFASGQATVHGMLENGTQKSWTLEGKHFEMLENQFYANPIVQFSCHTHRDPEFHYPDYGTTFEISSVDIAVKHRP